MNDGAGLRSWLFLLSETPTILAIWSCCTPMAAATMTTRRSSSVGSCFLLIAPGRCGIPTGSAAKQLAAGQPAPC